MPALELQCHFLRPAMWLHCLLLLHLFFANSFASPQRQVKIANGTIFGSQVTVNSSFAWQFLGIPFAEKPLGSLRFARPQPIRKGWSEPLIATKPPNRCPQALHENLLDDKVGKELVAPFHEDCLYLNIWTPPNTEQPKAVMVWIHGGCFVLGEGLPTYNGAPLAALSDVVLITVHYRLGALGFLRLSEKVGGNWGMFDQQLALRWIQENIAAFGGDPQRVTIFGESAGAGSAAHHLANEESSRYFHRVIAQSGTSFSSWFFSPNATLMEREHRVFANHLDCSQGSDEAVLQCLRAKDASELVAMQENKPFLRWLPVLDGDFFTGDPREKKFPRKEVMIGVSEDEGGMIIRVFLNIFKKAVEKDPKAANMPPEQMLLHYLFAHYPFYPEPISPPAAAAVDPLLRSHVDPQNPILNQMRIGKAYGDKDVVCPANEMADALDRQGIPTFVFLFAHRSSFSPYPAHVGPTHGDEMPYMLRFDLSHPHLFPMTAAEQGLAAKMTTDWTNFAKTGKPASKEWQQFSGAKKEFLELGIPSKAKKGGVYRDDCGFWTAALPKLHAAGRAAMPKMTESGTAMRLVAVVIAVLIALFIFRFYQ